MKDDNSIDWEGYGVLIGKSGSRALALSSGGIYFSHRRDSANAFARELREHGISPCRVVKVRLRVDVTETIQ